ncbi:hypothetical protein LCGC14_2661420, partial [marine sediment metagenome]
MLDASGNAFITGSTESYGVGHSDVFIVKYDSGGNLLWSNAWGGSEEDLGFEIALDYFGNVFIMGWTLSYGAGSEDVFLLKYNSSGNLLWNNTWGGSGYEYAYEIALDASGNTCITGVTSSYGPGHSAVFLLKYDSSGNLMWDKTWGGSANDYGKGIALDSSGNTFITGIYGGAGYSDVFLLKYDSSGNLLLYNTWKGSGYTFGYGIALDTLGNAFITGDTGNYGEEGDFDVFLLKHELDTDSDGLSDNNENITYFTDPNNSDTDGDGLSDGWEVYYGLNPTWSS